MSSKSTDTKTLRESPQLNAFVESAPYMRMPILRLVHLASQLLPPGSRILDAGAGDAPYRQLFAHCQYITADFAETDYHDFSGTKLDIVCDLTDIPLENGSVDAVLCTEVLEHVPEPAHVLAEFRRLLKPGGRLFLTVPFLWEVHEAPYDFYRYTPYSLDRLLRQAGFAVDFIRPHSGRFATLAQFFHHIGQQVQPRFVDDSVAWSLPLPKLIQRPAHTLLSALLRCVVAPGLAAFDGLDRSRTFTLGYSVHCTVPQPETRGD